MERKIENKTRGRRETFQTYTYDEGGGVPARRRRRKFDLKAPFTLALPEGRILTHALHALAFDFDALWVL